MTDQSITAIVVVACNRPDSLKRLLFSLLRADYSGYSDIPLIISIDQCGREEVLQAAEQFEWSFGLKQVIRHESRLGLRNHILSCGYLTNQYDHVIVLEDDLYVSAQFYQFAQTASFFYGSHAQIAGISLYAYDFNELAHQPFIPLDDGYDNYFMQVPSSWGQIWSRSQWQGFMQFLEEHPNPVPADIKLSNTVIHQWPETSWKKYFYYYLVERDLYFVYPRISFTTNFGDTGTHYPLPTGSFQVNLSMARKEFNFSSIESSGAIFDAYFEITADLLKKYCSFLAPYDFEVDLYGTKELDKIKAKFLISSKECRQSEKAFAAQMIPHEQNIFQQIDGEYFSLATTGSFKPKRKTLGRYHAYQNKINVHELVDDNWFRIFISFCFRKLTGLFK